MISVFGWQIVFVEIFFGFYGYLSLKINHDISLLGDDQIEITFDCTDGNRRLGRQKLRRLDITDWKLSATIRLHAGVIHVACSGIQNIEAVEIILNLDGKIILGEQRIISALVKPAVNKAAGFFQMTTAGTDFPCKISSQITGLGFFCAAAD